MKVDKIMNILVLMAGDSKQFYDKGYKHPKPLIEVNGRMIIELVANSIINLRDSKDKVIFAIKRDDDQKYYISNIIKLLIEDAVIIIVESNTAGAACTALLAVDHIDNNEELLIVNGDQIIDIEYKDLLKNLGSGDYSAGTVVFKSVHPRWSYVKLDSKKNVVEAAEKVPISNHATAGTYFFKSGKDFVNYTKKMIMKDANTDGAFFICPVFNEMILDGRQIVTTEIEPHNYHSLMSPSLIEEYRVKNHNV